MLWYYPHIISLVQAASGSRFWQKQASMRRGSGARREIRTSCCRSMQNPTPGRGKAHDTSVEDDGCFCLTERETGLRVT